MVTSSFHRSSLFLLTMISIPLLSQDNFEKIDTQALISEIEQGYLYCDKHRSKLFDLVDQICPFETDKNSPALLLRSYIDAGYSVGSAEDILDVLEYVEQRLDELYRKMDDKQAETMYAYLDSVMRDIKDGALKADPADFSLDQKRDCCGDVIIPVGQTIKVREKLYVLRTAKFFQDVEFKADVTIAGDVSTNGTLSVTDEVVGCDLSVGCSINMSNSTNGVVGNINKGGSRFINNFGTNNTFVGMNSGNFLMTGTNNTGLGVNALTADTVGSNNTALGFGAMSTNTSGGANTAVGANALLQNTTGTFNTAVGGVSLGVNTTGISNTALGFGAMSANTIGGGNIAIGVSAGSALVSGNSNIYIANAGGGAAENNTIRVGTLGTQTAAYLQGVFGAAVAGGGLAVEVDAVGKLGTVVSSAEFKDDIQDMGDSSDAIMQLRPVTFVYKWDESHTQYGLIAEEVAQIFPDLVVNDLEGKPFSVRYQILPVLLLNQIQKQQASIQALADRVDRLENPAQA